MASYDYVSESRVSKFFLRLFLAVLGLAVGLFAYAFAWLSKTNYSNVSIVDQLSGMSVSSEYSDINQMSSGDAFRSTSMTIFRLKESRRSTTASITF